MDSVRILLEVLKAFVWEKPISATCMAGITAEAEGLFRLAKEQSVQGILAYKIREYAKDSSEEISGEIAALAKYLFMATVENTVKKEAYTEALSASLAAASIDHVLFKGIVVRELYAVPALRTFGDVDIAIREEDRKKSHQLMEELGYETVIDHGEVWNYKKGMEYYEIHTDIMRNSPTSQGDQRWYFQNFWQHCDKVGEHTFRFNPEYQLIYLLAHLAKHTYGPGAGIRMYLDFAFVMKQQGESLDWAWVLEELKKTGLDRFFCLVISATARWFGFSVPEAVPEADPDLCEELFRFTMEAGVYGFDNRKLSREQIRKAAEEGENGKRTAWRKILFPDVKQIVKRYTYLEKAPFLLPFAWIDRLFRNRKIIWLRITQIKDILVTDEKQVQKDIEFQRKIGL